MGWKRGRGLLRNLVKWASVVAVAVAVLLWFKPWKSGGGTVRFDYRCTFIYWGSENNEPLENLMLSWSAPKIENEFAGEFYCTWELYYIEDDNTLTLQMTRTRIVGLRGSRTSQLGIYFFGLEENTEAGLTLSVWMDRLYPREIFLRKGYFVVDKDKADQVTFRAYGYIDSVALWYSPKFMQENKTITFAFASGLYRENQLVERYEVFYENGPDGWYAMPRTA